MCLIVLSTENLDEGLRKNDFGHISSENMTLHTHTKGPPLIISSFLESPRGACGCESVHFNVSWNSKAPTGTKDK